MNDTNARFPDRRDASLRHSMADPLRPTFGAGDSHVGGSVELGSIAEFPPPPKLGRPAIPGFTIHRLIGYGSFANVYSATDSFGRRVALKTAHCRDAARFAREVAAFANLRHRRLVQYFDSGRTTDTAWISMELVGSRTLQHLIDGPTRPDLPQALAIAEQITEALGALHSQGLIHRDLKPANILLTESGEIKLADFGLAKPVAANESALTHHGDLIGTARYISPEQAEGVDSLTPATDFWSLGVVLVELLTGEPLFTGNLMAISKQIFTKPVDFNRGGIPAELRPLLIRLLDRSPARRFTDADDLAIALTRLRFAVFQSRWAFILRRGILDEFAAEHSGSGEWRPAVADKFVARCEAAQLAAPLASDLRDFAPDSLRDAAYAHRWNRAVATDVVREFVAKKQCLWRDEFTEDFREFAARRRLRFVSAKTEILARDLAREYENTRLRIESAQWLALKKSAMLLRFSREKNGQWQPRRFDELRDRLAANGLEVWDSERLRAAITKEMADVRRQVENDLLNEFAHDKRQNWNNEWLAEFVELARARGVNSLGSPKLAWARLKPLIGTPNPPDRIESALTLWQLFLSCTPLAIGAAVGMLVDDAIGALWGAIIGTTIGTMLMATVTRINEHIGESPDE